MTTAHKARCRSGQAMVICLVVIGFLTTLLGAVSMILLTHSKLANYQQHRLSAFYLARAGLEAGNLLLLQDDPSVDALSDGWNAAAAEAGGQLGEGRFGLGRWPAPSGKEPGLIVDEERKLNLNTVTPSMLEALSPAISEDIARAVLEGRPFSSTTEAWQVMGLSDQKLREATPPHSSLPLRAHLTVHGSGRLNVNTAPLATLRCVPGLSEEAAGRLIDHRRGKDGQSGTADDAPFDGLEKVQELLQAPEDSWQQMQGWLTVRSTCFTVRGWGRTETNPVASVHLRQILRRKAEGLIILEFHQGGDLPTLEGESANGQK